MGGGGVVGGGGTVGGGGVVVGGGVVGGGGVIGGGGWYERIAVTVRLRLSCCQVFLGVV